MSHPAVLTVRVLHRRYFETQYFRFTGDAADERYVRHLVKRRNKNATVVVVSMPPIEELIYDLERAELFENRHVLDVIAGCAS